MAGQGKGKEALITWPEPVYHEKWAQASPVWLARRWPGHWPLPCPGSHDALPR